MPPLQASHSIILSRYQQPSQFMTFIHKNHFQLADPVSTKSAQKCSVNNFQISSFFHRRYWKIQCTTNL